MLPTCQVQHSTRYFKQALIVSSEMFRITHVFSSVVTSRWLRPKPCSAFKSEALFLPNYPHQMALDYLNSIINK